MTRRARAAKQAYVWVFLGRNFEVQSRRSLAKQLARVPVGTERDFCPRSFDERLPKRPGVWLGRSRQLLGNRSLRKRTGSLLRQESERHEFIVSVSARDAGCIPA